MEVAAAPRQLNVRLVGRMFRIYRAKFEVSAVEKWYH